MPKDDAIQVFIFDDIARVDPITVQAAPRPHDRPRPDFSTYPHDPIAVIFVDSVANSPEPASLTAAAPQLAYDVLVFDADTHSFVPIFWSGTPLSAMRARSLTLVNPKIDAPITTLSIYTRTRSAQHIQPTPLGIFRFPHDIRGMQLTVRLGNPADLNSLVVEFEPICGRDAKPELVRLIPTPTVMKDNPQIS